ncbi:MAG TPA: site-2 protease family protein, partial [Candidatus Nitrosopolaris sp.]|nr:site-2 protease family protein [Candidatus Nitrosopolaris sp.]
MQVLLFALAIVLFIGLVIIHEWGHYIAAKRNGVQAEEFGLGIPPRAWGKKLKNGVLFSVNWLPLGGFVKLKGEHDSDTKPGSFGAASLGAKTKIMLAGVFMNLIAGLVILTILALTGLPKLLDTDYGAPANQFTVKSDTKVSKQEVLVGTVQAGSPASQLGFASSDVIKSLESGGQTRQITSVDDLQNATSDFAGQNVVVTYQHNGKTLSKPVKLRSRAEVLPSLKTANPKGYLGVAPVQLQIRRSTWSAPVVAVGFTGQLGWLTLQGLWHALSGLGSAIAGTVTGNHAARENGQTQASSQVGGPVAIGAILWGYSYLGFSFVFTIIAVISLLL